MYQNSLNLIIVVLGLVAWYYYNKFKESEKEYVLLHKQFAIENHKLKSRLKDLQTYRNDVSKTFRILDNELVLINDHIQKQNQNSPQNDRVSILTSDMLSSLFENINQDQEQNQTCIEEIEDSEPEPQPQPQPEQRILETLTKFDAISNNEEYEKYKIT